MTRQQRRKQKRIKPTRTPSKRCNCIEDKTWCKACFVFHGLLITGTGVDRDAAALAVGYTAELLGVNNG